MMILALAISVSAQIPNNGFENWTVTGNYSTPDGWGNLNPVTSAGSVYTCLKGTPGNVGTAYLKLISKTVSGMGVVPGIAVSGVLNPVTHQAVSGFPYTNRPASLTGKWQYMAYLSDKGYIATYLTKWSTTLHKRDTIAFNVTLLPGMVMSWQSFTTALSYKSAETPDSAMIILSASGNTPVNGSYFYLDALAFSGGNVGIPESMASSALTVYPNPVSGNSITIDAINHEITVNMVEIFDISGKLVSRIVTDNHLLPVNADVSTLRAGTYILRITFPPKTLETKFIRQ